MDDKKIGKVLRLGSMYGAERGTLVHKLIEAKAAQGLTKVQADEQLTDYLVIDEHLFSDAEREQCLGRLNRNGLVTVPYEHLVRQERAALELARNDPQTWGQFYGSDMILPEKMYAPLSDSPGKRTVDAKRRERDRLRNKKAAKARKKNRALR